MTEISDDKADERRIIIIHKRQNKNIKVCRQSRADLNKRLNKVNQTVSNETIQSSGTKSVVEIVNKRMDSINTNFFVIHNSIIKIIQKR